MEIKFKADSLYGIRDTYELIVKAENVHLVEDAAKRIYEYDENGKINMFNAKIDVSEEALDKISGVLADMMEYREQEYDSTVLIEKLLDKLPTDKLEKILSYYETT